MVSNLISFFNKIRARIRRLLRDAVSRTFIRHNRAVFARPKNSATSKREVLFELNSMHSAHIAYSYLANVLAERDDAIIKCYLPLPRETWLQRFAFTVDKLFGSRELGVFNSFGSQACLAPNLSAQQRILAQTLFDKTVNGLKSTQDVEDLVIDGVWIGDLVYDTYLMACKQPTIDIAAADFQRILKTSLDLFVFWQEYITPPRVSAINVSHCVYIQAIPLRIGVKKGIPVFQSGITHVYRLDINNLFAYNDFLFFPERFAALPEDVQSAGLEDAEQRIKRRFSGEVGVDMSYSTKSAYGEFKKSRLIKESPRIKILIATHCFFDSPHGYGNNLFPDFYQWLDFLGQLTLVTDYDWYIKTHPDFLPGTKEIIDAFVNKYPKFNLLPADSSHHQLIAEGVDFALTVLGTIGFEYAALGIPVINASVNNPHIAYDFNFHPKSIQEYRDLLMHLDTVELKIDKTQVYEHYFMARIFNTQDLFFDDYDATINSMVGYDGQFTPKAYEKWLAQWSPAKHKNLLNALERFVGSGDFRMDYRHQARESSVKSLGARP